jgi:plastocyanin domain-containing protein
MQLRLIISILISVMLIGWAFWVASPKADQKVDSVTSVSIVDGVQMIDITAKGGYSPRVVSAKAGIPTNLRVATNGTYDCSASLVIPKLSYQKFLQPTAIETITIPADKAEGTLQGLCSMGMYGFQIRFE